MSYCMRDLNLLRNVVLGMYLYDGQWSRTKDNHRSPSQTNQEDK